MKDSVTKLYPVLKSGDNGMLIVINSQPTRTKRTLAQETLLPLLFASFITALFFLFSSNQSASAALVPSVAVGFSASSFTTIEGGPAIISVTLDKASSEEVTVLYSSEQETAIAGVDYTTTTGELTIPVGELTGNFSVPIIEDSLYEGEESLMLYLGQPSGAVLDSLDSARLLIQDNDSKPTVQFSQALFSAMEGASAAMVTASLNVVSGLPVTVNYTAGNHTAESVKDYILTPGQLVFSAGERTKTFTVNILDDNVDEDTEDFFITLSSPVNANLGSPNPATFNILDDTATPSIGFQSSTFDVVEGDAKAVLTLTLSTLSSKTVTVDYVTEPGSAEENADYTPVETATQLSIAPLHSTGLIEISLGPDDDMYEGVEDFSVVLSNPSNAILGAVSEATVEIADDEVVPKVSFSSDKYSAPENEGQAAVSLVLDRKFAVPVSITVKSSNGSAEAGKDFQEVSKVVTFPAGSTSQMLEITLLDDTLNEGDEEFSLALSSPSAGLTIGNPQTAVFTILDNDSTPTLNFSALKYSYQEGTSTAVVTVTLSATSGRTVTVDYETQAGSATPGQDFSSVSGTLTFSPGTVKQTIAIPLLNDRISESTESFSVTLANSKNAQLGTQKVTQVEVLNDDWYSYLPMLGLNYDPNLLFEDMFTSSLGWSVTTQNQGVATLVNDKYYISQQSEARIVRTISPVEAEKLGSRYYVEVEAQGISGANILYGITFDFVSNEQLYAFVLAPQSQSFAVWKYENGWKNLGNGTGIASISTGVNKLRVERTGSTIRVFANGGIEPLVTITNASSGGRVGLEMWPVGTPAVAAFDNFRVGLIP